MPFSGLDNMFSTDVLCPCVAGYFFYFVCPLWVKWFPPFVHFKANRGRILHYNFSLVICEFNYLYYGLL